MGGYGATRIGMKHADVFGSLYIMSPCCLSARGTRRTCANPASEEALAAVKTPADSAKLPFGLRAQLASAAAWSPNPNNPPLYLDLPIGDEPAGGAGEVGGERAARLHRSVRPATPQQYRAIAIDVGDQDGLRVDTGKLHDALDGIRHHARFRDLSGHAHQRRRGALPGPRAAVLQPDAFVRGNSGPQRPVIPQQLTFTPYHASGIYDVGETVGWTVTPGPAPPTYAYKWTIRRNNAVVLKEGKLDLSTGKDTIEIAGDQPEMIYVAVEAVADLAPAAPTSGRATGRASSEATPAATTASTPSAPPSRRRRSGCRRRGRQTSTRSGSASSRRRRRFRSTRC